VSSILDLILKEPSMADRYMTSAPMVAGSPTAATPGPTGNVSGTSDWEQVAQDLAYNKYGYSPEDWNKLDYIIEHESSWNPNAVNDSSGAYGIPQILPKAHPGLGLENDPMGQIRWLFNYINNRYGGVDAAYDWKVQNGWY